jgi:anti-sigma-K factor RskA
MTHSHGPFEESVAAYALDALDAEERRTFEAHLATCRQCANDLAELRKVTTGLALAVDPVAPPPDLKSRTLARATAQPQRRPDQPASAPSVAVIRPAVRPSPLLASFAWLAAAAGIALAVASGIYAWSLRAELAAVQKMADDASTQADRLRAQLLLSRQEAARMSQTMAILGAPDVVRVDLKGQSDLTTASAQVYWSATRGVLFLNAGNLPVLDAGRVFELWAVPPGASPQPAGLFTVDPAGLVTTVAPPPGVFPAADAFAITIEPAGGSPQATTPIILVGKVRKG